MVDKHVTIVRRVSSPDAAVVMFADGKDKVTPSLTRYAVEQLIKSDADRVILGQAWAAGMEEILKREKMLRELENSLNQEKELCAKTEDGALINLDETMSAEKQDYVSLV